MAKSTTHIISSWAFLLGVIIAFITGFFSDFNNNGLMVILVIIGIIVGLINIPSKDAKTFLLAGTVIVIVASLSLDTFSVMDYFFMNINKSLILIFSPATIIVALRSVFTLTNNNVK